MQLHGLAQSLMEVFEVGKVTVCQVILHFAVFSFQFEVQKYIGLVHILFCFGSQLHFKPPFDIQKIIYIVQLVVKNHFSQFFQIVLNSLHPHQLTSLRNIFFSFSRRSRERSRSKSLEFVLNLERLVMIEQVRVVMTIPNSSSIWINSEWWEGYSWFSFDYQSWGWCLCSS